LDPERRAVLIAKNMNRWDPESGWVPESDLDENPNVSADDAMTIAEFAEQSGKNRGLIYQQLSPLRQDSQMRDEFGEEITETSFQLIERICDEKSEQYTLAQALSKSDIDTHSKFQSSYRLAKKQAGDDDNLVNVLCRRLIGLKVEETHSDTEPVPQPSRKNQLIERRSEQLEEQEQQERERAQQRLEQKEKEYGHSFPTPDDVTDTDDKNLNLPDDEDDVDESIRGSGAGFSDESGASVLPPTEDQPFPDRKLEVTIPGDRDVAQLLREAADDRSKSLEEYVVDVLKVHFRKSGDLKDTPKSEIPSS
jgi:hypothetical protein